MTNTVAIALAADQYGAEKAKVEVWLGSERMGAFEIAADHRLGQAEALTFSTENWGGDPPAVNVYLLNDAWGGTDGTDRNAYLLGATCNGVYVSGPVAIKTNNTRGTLAFPQAAPPAFCDDFAADPARWIVFDGQHWPPLAGAKGTWSRCFYYGWPSNTGSADPAARTLKANKEAQCYEDRAVTVTSDGCVLTATRDANNHHGLPWTSGCIVQSRDKAQLYGYFEMEAVLPDAPGAWPAFWLLSADMQWPPEIDVVERVGLGADGKRSSSAFHVGFAGGMGGNGWASGNLQGLHRYGVLWGPTTTEFFLDGVSVGSFPTPDGCRKPMYMLANLAVGGAGSWPGQPDAALQTASMTIRRIRSWTLGSWGGAKLPV